MYPQVATYLVNSGKSNILEQHMQWINKMCSKKLLLLPIHHLIFFNDLI